MKGIEKMSNDKRTPLGEHLASFEDAFGDGEATYWREVDERQKTPKSRRKKPKKTLRERIEDVTRLPKGIVVRSEDRDKVAEKIRKAKTHEEKMAIAQKYHRKSLAISDRK